MTNLAWKRSDESSYPGRDISPRPVSEDNPYPVGLVIGEPGDGLARFVTDNDPLPTRDADVLAALRVPFRFASSVLITCAAAGDYAAGDVWSSTATNTAGKATYVPNLARPGSGLAVIVGIRAVSSNASLLNRMRLQWFQGDPLAADVEMDDNAVFALSTVQGRNLWVGSTLMGAFNTKGTAELIGAQEPLRTAGPGEAGLYLVLTTEDAEANEVSNQTVRLDFYSL